MTQNEEQFWQYFKAIEQQSIGAKAFKRLRDLHGADLNLLIFMLWRGTCGARLSASELDRALAIAAHWRSVVIEPLRQVHRSLQHPPPGFIGAEALRASVARAETEAARLEQAALAGLLPEEVPLASDPKAMQDNLIAYLARLGLEGEAYLSDLIAAGLAAHKSLR